MNSYRIAVRFSANILAGLAFALVVGMPATAVTINHFVLPDPNPGMGAVAGGPDGNVWFTEPNANRIGRVTPAGVVSEFSVPTANSYPSGIVTGPDGNLWFTEFAGNKIARITPLGQVTEFPVPTAFSQPGEITLGPDGNLWFTEGLRKLGRITPSGVIAEFSVSPVQAYSIVAGQDGNLWFTGGADTVVVGRMTPEGAMTVFPAPSGIGIPMTICGGPDSGLWFATYDLGWIGRMSLTGVYSAFRTPNPGAYIQLPGITSGPDGNVWYTRQSLTPPLRYSAVGRITPAGETTEFPAPSGGNITTGPDGNIWFTVSDGICQLVMASVPSVANAFSVSSLQPIALALLALLLGVRTRVTIS